MLRDEHYHKIANEFGTNVGVMEWSGDIYPHYTNISKMPDGLKVNILTNLIIREGIYHKVHRELFRLRIKIGKRRIKESTLYEKAINNVLERDNIILHY